MAGIPRHPDLIDRIKQQNRTVGRMRIAKPPRNTENFIIDPVAVRDMPPAFASPRGAIIGVMARLGSGGPVTVSFRVVRLDPPSDESNPRTVHTFTDLPGDGVVYYQELPDPYYPFDLELGDYYYPSITDGTGNDLTMSFVMTE